MNSVEVFEKVVQEEGQRLYCLCYRLTGNSQEAEDLSQEALARAFKGFERFEGRSKVSTWLYRITLNAWKNRIRAKKKISIFSLFQKDGMSDPENEFAINEPRGNDPAPDSAMERLESGQILQEGLMSLDKEEREIVVLRDLEEKSYEELSDLLGIPLGTVKSRLARAREALRLKLTPLLKARGELA